MTVNWLNPCCSFPMLSILMHCGIITSPLVTSTRFQAQRQPRFFLCFPPVSTEPSPQPVKTLRSHHSHRAGSESQTPNPPLAWWTHSRISMRCVLPSAEQDRAPLTDALVNGPDGCEVLPRCIYHGDQNIACGWHHRQHLVCALLTSGTLIRWPSLGESSAISMQCRMYVWLLNRWARLTCPWDVPAVHFSEKTNLRGPVGQQLHIQLSCGWVKPTYFETLTACMLKWGHWVMDPLFN